MAASRASHIIAKWVGFVTAIWVQAIAGNNYSFSNYSVELKAILQYNQLELNSLGVAKDVGKALGLLAGVCSDYFPPWAILLTGALEGLLGYGAQWLVVSQRIAPRPFWQMCVMMCMGGNSTTWMNTAVLVTCMRNFKSNRGPVVGILKGYIGLSTAIFTDLCTALFTSDAASFVLMLAIIPFNICVVAMLFLVPVESSVGVEEKKEEKNCLVQLNLIATSLAIYLLVFDLQGSLGSSASKLFAVFMLLFLAAPLIVPIRLLLVDMCKRRETNGGFIEETVVLSIEDEKTTPLLSTIEDDNHCKEQPVPPRDPEIVEDTQACDKKILRLGDEHNLGEALQTLDFWLLFIGFLSGVGTGMVVINNLGQIGQALGHKSVAVFVSLFSIWGFFGRIGSGLLSEHYIRSRGLARPVWLAGSQILMITAFIMLAMALPGSLYMGSIVVGISYGVRLAISVPIASELFGLKNFGMLYNFLILNIPLGSFLFSGLLAGYLYDREAGRPSAVGPNSTMDATFSGRFGQIGGIFASFSGPLGAAHAQTCTGGHCFRIVFIIMAGVCLLGCLFDIVLVGRTKALYSSLQTGAKGKIKPSPYLNKKT
ncbi:hypothetical protein O6H91_01G158900 [Diphasiastrum complanatum]|uniref:Uncharacterized protein n=1 Tax=Diphasiastrum complanatum TaxID=34168 RepID=A0ACC2EXQ5_DIPCM|nr:hypothetical protein O6H91_01G158900 [Diphasiastrum complanatum]